MRRLLTCFNSNSEDENSEFSELSDDINSKTSILARANRGNNRSATTASQATIGNSLTASLNEFDSIPPSNLPKCDIIEETTTLDPPNTEQPQYNDNSSHELFFQPNIDDEDLMPNDEHHYNNNNNNNGAMMMMMDDEPADDDVYYRFNNLHQHSARQPPQIPLQSHKRNMIQGSLRRGLPNNHSQYSSYQSYNNNNTASSSHVGTMSNNSRQQKRGNHSRSNSINNTIGSSSVQSSHNGSGSVMNNGIAQSVNNDSSFVLVTRDYIEQFKVILLGDSSVGKSSLISRYESNTFSEDTSQTIGIEFSNCTIEVETTNINRLNNANSEEKPTISPSTSSTSLSIKNMSSVQGSLLTVSSSLIPGRSGRMPSPAKSLPAHSRYTSINGRSPVPYTTSMSFNANSSGSNSGNNTPLVKRKQRVQLQLWDAAGDLDYSDFRQVYYQGCHAVVLVYNVCDAQSFIHVKREWLEEVKDYIDRSVQVNTKSKTRTRQHVVFMVIANKIDNDAARVISFQDGQEFADSIHAQYFETSARTGQNVKVLFHRLAKELHNYFNQFMSNTTL